MFVILLPIVLVVVAFIAAACIPISNYGAKVIPMIISILAILTSFGIGFIFLIDQGDLISQRDQAKTIAGAILFSAATLASTWLGQFFLTQKSDKES